MPDPGNSPAWASVQLPTAAECGGVTELRVHGVGATPRALIDGDPALEQASGDRHGGFYRISPHHASSEDQAAHRDVDRHVEVYVSGGLDFSSKSRVLWLALLPFLLSNIAGWMCSPKTRQSRWRFRLHRLAYGLGALALTVNAFLVAVMITVDILAYQVSRAGLARHQWWNAPLSWHFVVGHPARQVMLGMVVPVLLLLVITWLASRSWRYEAVRPRLRGKAPARPRPATAAVLGGGLTDNEFWDGERSVRLLTWVHVAVVAGFLAIVLAVTAKALTATGSSQDIALGWIAIGLGAVAVALGAGYICLDALGTPPMDMLAAAAPDGRLPAGSALADKLRGQAAYLLIPAAVALIVSGEFAWLQPGGPAGRAAELPGMASVIRWTALAIAVPVAAALVSTLLGLSRGGSRALFGGPWVTLALAFSLLNTAMLGAGIAAAHIAGSVTSNAAAAVSPSHGMIYLPYLITSGVPLAALAAVAAVVVFTMAELVRWLHTVQMPAEMRKAYQDQAQAYKDQQSEPMRDWFQSGLPPLNTSGDGLPASQYWGWWERNVARAQLRGSTLLNAGWLLWGIIIAQLVVILCAWQLHRQPSTFIASVGVGIATLALPARLGFLYAKWRDPAQRTMTIFWDVGTFWPRSYHPLSPPCYTEQAVPDLQRRIWLLHDIGRQVVLVADGQGAMLATAALIQPGCRSDGDHPALVTFGSTAGKLYGWGFPAYVTPEVLAPLEPGGPARLNDWRNLYYPTDPIGGPAAGNLSSADGGPVDLILSDPVHCLWIDYEDPPLPQGHSGYWEDPRVWELVNKVAAAAQRIPVTAVSQPSGPAPRRHEAAEGVRHSRRKLPDLSGIMGHYLR